MWETRFTKVAKRYLYSTFITEFISIYPNIILQVYYAAAGIPRSTYQRHKIYIVFSFMRLLRLSKIQSLNQQAKFLVEITVDKSLQNRDVIMNIFKMAKTAFMLFVFLHFCAVVNVFYGMQSFGWV